MKRKIMVIDDEEILTRTFARLLQRKDYDVRTANRSEEALRMTQEEDFDLVLCDIRMPGKNGVETISEIQSLRRKNEKAPLPVIFLTGFADTRAEDEARTLNPVAYILKPFDTHKLLAVIESVLSVES